MQDKSVEKHHELQLMILLVGGNPLPNYVAAQVLQPARVLLVHSASTKAIAERLQRVLSIHADLVEVEESSPRSIFDEITSALEERKPRRVSLHYTGGTKAMAIHAYRAVEQWSQRNRAEWSASYLDARRQVLVFDQPQEESKYVGDKLSLTLEEMLKLHGWSLGHSRVQPVFPGTAREIALSYTDDCTKGLQPPRYQKWKEQVLRPLRRQNSRDWLSEGQLKQNTLDLPVGDLPQVAAALQRELGIEASQVKLEQAKAAGSFSKTEDFCKWLDGAWLESYVLHIVQNLPDEVRPQEVFHGVKTKEIDFELDVVAVRGYQPFVFSCTTAGERSALKLKLFEAILRARQIGGDQARVALVCTYKDPLSIQREARAQIDPDNQNQIRVFGCGDLAELGDRIAEWIRDQARD